MSKRQTLDSWIHDAMTDGEKDGPIAALVLMHVQNGANDVEVHAIRFTGARKWTASELAALFNARADAIANGIPGPQTFKLLAFYNHLLDGEQKPWGEPEAWIPFTKHGEPEYSREGIGTELPSEKGVTQQTMRHLEVMFQETTRMARNMFDRMTEAADSAVRQNTALQRELNDTYKVMREQYLTAEAEKHKQYLEALKVQQNNRMIDAATKYAPALINTISGREIFPQPTADSALIDSIVQSLKPEMIPAIQSILPPDAFALLMARFEQGLEKRLEAENAAGEALSKGGGENDVAGELSE